MECLCPHNAALAVAHSCQVAAHMAVRSACLLPSHLLPPLRGVSCHSRMPVPPVLFEAHRGPLLSNLKGGGQRSIKESPDPSTYLKCRPLGPMIRECFSRLAVGLEICISYRWF